MKNESSLLDVLLAVARHRWFLTIYVIVFLGLATAIAFWLPKQYESSITFVRQSTTPGGNLSGLLSNLGALGMSGSSKLDSEAALILLQSQELREKVINKFDLFSVYEKEYLSQILKALESRVLLEETREGGLGFNPITAISLTVTDEDPVRAKEMADYFVSTLDSMMVSLNEQIQTKTVSTLEERYAKNLIDLARAETNFKAFQEEYGIIELEEQTKAFVQSLATLQAEKIALGVEIKTLNEIYGKNAPNEIGLKQLQYDKVQQTLDELTNKSDMESLAKDGLYPLKNIPDLGFQYLNLYREFEVQQTIYEMLVPQLELNRMYLSDKHSGIQIIDPAKVPSYKSKPKRAFIMAGGLLFAIFSGLLIVYLLELKRKLDAGEHQQSDKWQHLRAEFRK